MTAYPPDNWDNPPHRSAVTWVVAIAAFAIVFDGYDLVVYGTILPLLLDDPGHLGHLTPSQAGALGAYALTGLMVGALLTGAVGDYLGRRRMMLINITWFSIGMGLTALAPTVTTFGLLRFLTGIGMGGLAATAAVMVAEVAPAGKRNLYNAIVYCGMPVGGVLASLIAIVLRDSIGWRGLFWIGTLPLVALLPLALLKLPESPRWLLSRGREHDAETLSSRTGIPLPQTVETPPDGIQGKVGYAALATRRYARTTALLGIMSFSGMLITYGLNTWLPRIMENTGFNAKDSLSFLLVLNGGAIIGGLLASKVADHLGAQRVVITTFGLAALALVLLTVGFPLPLLLASVAIAGVGTIGTQVLIYGFASNHYSTEARGAGVAWCAGFGRLGGILGPLIGGALISAGIGSQGAFYIFSGVAALGAIVTTFVPRRTRNLDAAPATADASPSLTTS